MSDLPHLQLRNTYTGIYKSKSAGSQKKSPKTEYNKANRKSHGAALSIKLGNLEGFWLSNLEQRKKDGFPDLPEQNIIPILLQFDSSFDIESLKGLGVEIVLEEENGFVVGATAVNFYSLKDRINALENESGKYKNQLAKLWDIEDGVKWKLEHILSEELSSKWDKIGDEEIYILDAAIACYVKQPLRPVKEEDETNEKYQKRLDNWQLKQRSISEERDDIAFSRQDLLEEFVKAYGGDILSSFVDSNDSFGCQIKLSGRALKDFALNYQYLFYLSEADQVGPFIENNEIDSLEDRGTLNLLPPPDSAPKVCVIDSGIQENHKLLSPAIDFANSKSFIPNDTSTADWVQNGGHGTKVAGAILYPKVIPQEGTYQLPFWIQNARVLDSSNMSTLYFPKLMEDIVSTFLPTKIFNLSITSTGQFRFSHMSSWASSIDKLSYLNDILVIVSTGNTSISNIRKRLNQSKSYPDFLNDKSNRVLNPAQSCFALTVGSICSSEYNQNGEKSFGVQDKPSAFTKSGPGIWGMIKPDVVEYGGDLIYQIVNGEYLVRYKSEVATELIQSTLNVPNHVGKDIGTSFSTPKVSHIAAALQKILPTESAQMYRNLVVQSARLPFTLFRNPKFENLVQYGYGIPDVNRATGNTENRITFIASNDIIPKQARLYSIRIPDSLRNAGDNFDILIEFTLTFKANPRRTRMKTKSYLSGWADWYSSKLGQSFERFKEELIRELEESDDEIIDSGDTSSIQWFIRERNDWGTVKNLKRQDSSVQKDWCILKSNQLPKELCFAVVGHKGWETDLSKKIPFSISVSIEAIENSIAIYEAIRVENEVEVRVEV